MRKVPEDKLPGESVEDSASPKGHEPGESKRHGEEDMAPEEKQEGTSDAGSQEQGGASGSRDTILYISIAVVLVLIAGFIGALMYAPDSADSPDMFTYNGFRVTNVSGQYYTYIKMPEREQSHVIEMRESPNDAALVPMEKGIKQQILSAETLYLVTDPDEESRIVIGMVEVGKIVGGKYDILNIPTVVGLTEPVPNSTEERQVITCENSTQQAPVIYFRKGDSNMVYTEDSCIIVEGTTGDEVILASDKLGYVLLGIITLP